MNRSELIEEIGAYCEVRATPAKFLYSLDIVSLKWISSTLEKTHKTAFDEGYSEGVSDCADSTGV